MQAKSSNSKENSKIKVSVIMPIYNGEKIIDEYLPQVLNQSLKEVNFFLVNDGSKDKTLEILKKYEANDPRIKVLTQENGGAGSARNLGINYLKEHPEYRGEYLWFPDLGDDFDLDFLSKMWKNGQINHADLVLTGAFRIISAKLGYERKRPWKPKKFFFDYPITLQSLSPEILLSYISTSPWDKLYSSKIIFQNNLYFDLLPVNEDETWNLLFYCLAQRISFFDETLVYYNTSYFRVQEALLKQFREKANFFLNTLNEQDLVDPEKVGSVTSSYRKYYPERFKVFDSCQNQMKKLGIWEQGKNLLQTFFVTSVGNSFNFIDHESRPYFLELFYLYCQKLKISENWAIKNKAFLDHHLLIFKFAEEYKQISI